MISRNYLLQCPCHLQLDGQEHVEIVFLISPGKATSSLLWGCLFQFPFTLTGLLTFKKVLPCFNLCLLHFDWAPKKSLALSSFLQVFMHTAKISHKSSSSWIVPAPFCIGEPRCRHGTSGVVLPVLSINKPFSFPVVTWQDPSALSIWLFKNTDP